ncbi:MAG TPA: hydrogenase maturation protease, partial [Candidatus Binataceae bacterium]|nr:hydrogenase maturation protease [Candidatus Binataceae bacterium]
CDLAILVDATPRGGPPGALYIIEPDAGPPAGDGPDDLLIDAHTMDPVKVLRLAARMGARPAQVILVGCEPVTLASDDELVVEMSAPVGKAVNEAERLVAQLIERAVTCESLPISGSILR